MTQVGVGDLRRLIETFVSDYPARSNVRNWWRTPLLVTARCYDRLLSVQKHPDLAGLPAPGTEVCGKCQVMLPCGFGVPELP